VHLYTASGALTAFAALHAIAHGEIRRAFLWLWCAVAIDATDGTLARWADVKRHLPEFDGARLDDIVDYQTYVLVPIVLMIETGLLAGIAGQVAAIAALVASAYRFCHVDAKTPDHFFTGFPSYWNVLALYLYVYRLGAPWNALVTLGLAILVFAPLRFVYPSRMAVLRVSTISLGAVWAAMTAWLVATIDAPPAGLAVISLLYPAYYAGLSFWLQWRDRTRKPATR
jgi:phosphatidylcholine synthase